MTSDARPGADDRIHYRVVGEYDTQFTWEPESSDQPLTLGALIALIDSVSVLEEHMIRPLEEGETYFDQLRIPGIEPDEIMTISAESFHYPGLAACFESRQREAERRWERGTTEGS